MVPNLNIVHPSTNTLDDTAALVSQDDGERAFGILPREGVGVGVADAGAVSVSGYLAEGGDDIWDDDSEWERSWDNYNSPTARRHGSHSGRRRVEVLKKDSKGAGKRCRYVCHRRKQAYKVLIMENGRRGEEAHCTH
jgi:hypothetical protein